MIVSLINSSIFDDTHWIKYAIFVSYQVYKHKISESMKNLKKYKFGIAIIGLIIFFTACEKDQLLDQLYQNGAGQSYSDNDLISIINDLSISADEKEDLLL